MTIQTNQQRILVLGGGYAGILAALRIAGRGRDSRPQVTLVNASDRFVERIRLHEAAVGRPVEPASIPHLLRGSGVAFVRGRVTAIDVERRLVAVDVEGEPRRLAYDTLVYALGSTIDTEAVPGAAEHAFALSGPAAAAALHDAARREAARGGRLAVCGGGLTGIEAAAELAEAFPSLQVSLVTRGRFGEAFSAKGRDYLRQTFDRLRIEIVENTAIERVEPGALLLRGGATLRVDLCLWAGSFRTLPLAREAGFEVNRRGQIVVGHDLRSRSHPEVFVVGDAGVLVPDPGAPIRMGCVTAEPMAAHAADNVVALLRGEPMQPFRFGYVIWCVSLGRRRGLVQLVRGDDTPKDTIVSGRVGATIKDLICRMAYQVLDWERRWPGAYRWPKRGRTENARRSAQPVHARG